MINSQTQDGIATDIISGIQTRRSMQSRRSLDPHRMSVGSSGYGRRSAGDREGLIRAYDEEENMGFGLTDLANDSDDDDDMTSSGANGKTNGMSNGNENGSVDKRSFSEPVERPRR